MDSNKRISEYLESGHYCAGNGCGNFRRASSLRVRGEKMVQRSPLSTKKFPIITEDTHLKHRNYGTRSAEPDQRKYSCSSNAQNKSKSVKLQEQCMDKRGTRNASTPPASPEELPDDESLHSYGSGATAASIDAGYAPFNGTTFSGKSMRYVLHCSAHAGLAGEDYLTPTQRAQKQIKKLKHLLNQAKKDLERKDSEIFQLTKEVVELKLYKASICSPDDKSNSSEIVTIKETAKDGTTKENISRHEEVCDSFDVTDSPLFKQETPTRSRNSEMQGSFTDSGHYDDLTNSSLHSKESVLMHDASCMTEFCDIDEEHRTLISYYEKKIEDIVRSHIGETQKIKESHNDKVESLLQKLSDVNTHYCELLPNYEQAKDRIHTLERHLEEVNRQLQEEEKKHHSMYLQMYDKGVEAARFDLKKEESAQKTGQENRISVEDLLKQLQITQTELENVRAMYRRILETQKTNKGEVDPEVTLQFLKSAIYYFLTDPVNHDGHLNAIENILGFSEEEKADIRNGKARSTQ